MVRPVWRRALFGGCLAALSLGMVAAGGPVAQKSEGMGPQDVAVIPIESVPGWVSEGVARTIPSQVQGGLEVLAVLRDPRDVPIDRFLYALTERGEVMVHPQAEAIRRSFEGRGHSAVAVYVRVTARAEIPVDSVEIDPFYVDPLEVQAANDSFHAPWDGIGVADSHAPDSVLPCLEPMTIEKGVKAFDAPDTGVRIRPDEYLPPTPHYEVVDQTGIPGMVMGGMAAGETREGWLLCLAPDVPVQDVRVVPVSALMSGNAGGVYGPPFWARIDEMQVGAWYRLENREVLGWNEEPAEPPGGDPRRVDEQVVYRGDVWVSMAQAFRYQYPSVDASENRFSDIFAVQMSFNGMNGLLTTWDQLAVKDGVALTFCGDIGSLGCGGPQMVEVRARGTHLEGSRIGHGPHDVGTGKQEVVWVHPGSLSEPGEAGRLPVWRMEFEELRVQDLGVEAVCGVTECLRGVVDSQNTELAFPLIAPGNSAFGLTVKSARFVSGEILRVDGMDVYLDAGSSSRWVGQYKWLVVEVDGEGIEYTVGPWNVAESASGIGAWRGVDYGIASGYETLGGKRYVDVWSGYTRAGRNGTIMAAEVPADWRLEDIVLIAGSTGPAWELPQ